MSEGITIYGNEAEQSEPMTQEEIIMNERDILAALIELGNEKDNVENHREILIKRDGVIKIKFRVRPLSEAESQQCWKQATKYAPAKAGQPKKPIETDAALFRAYLVYTATIEEDRQKLWDNKQAQAALGILHGVFMVDRVLKSGEKDRILNVIDEISGFDEDLEELAKN